MRKLWMFLLFIAIPAMMFADVVTEQDALLKARQFMPGKSFEQPQKPNRAPARDGKIENPAYYVFNATDNEGFVIISADDRTEAILGYSDNGSFDQDNMPSNVKAWFEYYEQSIRSLGDAPAQAPQQRASRAAIEPLIKTKWNQSNPYNLQCPMDGEERSITGCIATAIAQVMFYHKWPAATSQDIPAYTTTTKAINVEALPATTFKWNLMKYEYQNDAVGDTANAVAELMRYCGQISMMDYTSEESSANINTANLINHFNYSKNTRQTAREYYSNNQWEDLVYNEIANNRPVAYSGLAIDTKSAHEFICDGYDGNGLFHINWGWGGHYDGYFLLSDLNPSGRGLGGGSSSQGYSDQQWVLIGFSPASAQEEQVPQMISWDVSVSGSNYERNSAATDFESISLSGYIHTIYSVLPQKELAVETGWALYSDDTFKQCLGYKTNTVNNALEDDLNNGITVSFGADIEDGKYRICQVYRLAGETEWSLCQDAIRECLVVNINGNNMTVQKTNSKDKITIVSITQNDLAYVDYNLPITIKYINNGDNYKQTIKLSYKKKGTMSVGHLPTVSTVAYVNPGDTGEVRMTFIPTQEATYEITISCDGQCFGEKTLEIDVSEDHASSLEITDFTTSIEPVVNIPFRLVFNCTNKGTDTIPWVNYYCHYTAEGEEEEEAELWENIRDLAPDSPTTCQRIKICPKKKGSLKITLIYHTETKKEIAGIYTINVSDEVEIETIDNISYLCYNNSHNAIILNSAKDSISNDVVVPSSIVHSGIEYSVTAINDSAFYNNINITGLKIPEGVKSIGQNTFSRCYNLEFIDLPSSLKYINDFAFADCFNLQFINTRFDDPFYINENVFSISNYDNETQKKEHSQATLCIPVGTMDNYTSTSVWKQFPIFIEGFFDKTTFNNITYGYFTNINTAFILGSNKDNLSGTLTIPSEIRVNGTSYSVTSIADQAFKNNYNITSLKISEGVKTIGQDAFNGCYKIEIIDLPSTLTNIGEQAFYDISQLKYVNVEMENPFIINNNTFRHTYSGGWGKPQEPSKAVLCVPTGTLDIYKNTSGWDKFNHFQEGSAQETKANKLTFIYFDPSGEAKITMIDSDTTINSLIIPSIITVNNQQYVVTEIDIDNNKANNCPQNYTVTSLVVPEGVTSINDKAFCRFNGIQSIVLPSTLTSIGNDVFGCYNLRTVTARTSTPFAIADNTFGSNGFNADLFVPDNTVNSYKNANGWNKFGYICEEVNTELRGEIKETTINSVKYKYGTESKTAIITKAAKTITTSSAIQSSITVDGVEYAVIAIDNEAFYSGSFNPLYSDDCLIIPEGIIKIGEIAFFGAKFKSLELPSTLRYIGEQAFYYNPDLKTVTVKTDNPCGIGKNAFPVDQTVSLYVPEGAVAKYEASVRWKEFQTIVNIVNEIKQTKDNRQYDEAVSIYSLSGIMLFNDVNLQDIYYQLPPGIYLIQQKDQKTRKLIK